MLLLNGMLNGKQTDLSFTMTEIKITCTSLIWSGASQKVPISLEKLKVFYQLFKKAKLLHILDSLYRNCKDFIWGLSELLFKQNKYRVPLGLIQYTQPQSWGSRLTSQLPRWSSSTSSTSRVNHRRSQLKGLAVLRAWYRSISTESWLEGKRHMHLLPWEDCEGKSIQELGRASRGVNWDWCLHLQPPGTEVLRKGRTTES